MSQYEVYQALQSIGRPASKSEILKVVNRNKGGEQKSISEALSNLVVWEYISLHPSKDGLPLYSISAPFERGRVWRVKA